jgi:hypothetical protein
MSLREALPEQFDRAAIECVLAEWFKTMADLPAGLRMAVEMVRGAPLRARSAHAGVRVCSRAGVRLAARRARKP